jgi:phage terminase small subunit
MTKGLTNKQRVFIDEYLQCWNATEAARRAGYSERTATVIGHENLTKPDIRAEIETRLSEKHMSADEALTLLADMARGDLGEFMDVTPSGFVLDLLNDDGSRKNTRLIRKIKQRVTTFLAKKESDEDREIIETEIELYDAQAAIDKVLRVAGKYKDNVDLTSGGQPIRTIGLGLDIDKV